MPSASIAVRPPGCTQARAILNPPLIVKLSSKQCTTAGIHLFATAVLLDVHGRVADDGLLYGTTAVTGVLLNTLSAVLFVFSDLSITMAGRYTIRLDVYAMYPHSIDGATLIAQLESPKITVYDQAVPAQHPSSSEGDMIRLARRAGVLLDLPH